MKRAMILLVLLLVVTPIILAEENITEQTKERLSALRGGLDNKTENIFGKELDIHPTIEVPLKFVFGIEDGARWDQLIVVIGVFIGFFILILNISEIIPIFQGKVVRILSSLCITILVSITGSLDTLAKFFFDLAGFVKWTAGWPPFQIIIAIIIATVVLLIFNYVANKVKKNILLAKAEHVGGNINRQSKIAEIDAKRVEKISNN